MPAAMTLISSQTLGSAVASVTFGSGGTLTQAYRDLRLVIQGYNSSGSYQDFGMRFNGDSGANYSRVYMAGTGSGSGLSGATSSDTFSISLYLSGSSTDPSALTADILDYSQTDKHKTIIARNSGAGASAAAVASRWASTSAITSIVCMTASGANWAAGTTLSLYGVSA